ncbi:MAG: hypothetical protein AAF745_06185 [Planctomycetota bacterium]
MTWQIENWATGIRVCIAIATCLVLPAASAQAHGGGETIVSSQVISDVAVGSFDDGAMMHSDCQNGDCGGSYGDEVVDGGVLMEGGAMGGAMSRTHYGQPDLFYNYYTQGMSNAANAQMYISPVPTPANGGHTFFTYQPFYPHEMLYKHTNRFHNYYDNGRGLNRTRVQYSYPAVRTAASNFYWNVLRIPR